MRILIVEDDQPIVSFLRRGLEAEDHEVDLALDQQQVLVQAQKRVYDVIVLDIFLGRDNGFEICRNLRRRQLTMPILVLTAKDSVEMKKESLQAGADGYLPKPFAFEELLAQLRGLVTPGRTPGLAGGEPG